MQLTRQNPETLQLQKNGSLSNKRLIEIGLIINKARMIQGWNILSPDETKPVATLWAEQFDRVKIPAEMYPQLLDRAIDIRRDYLRQGKQIPALSIELMLAAYDAINADRKSTFNEWERMKYIAEHNGPREN